MSSISVCLNVIDDEIDVLPQALSSIKDFATEIVLINMTQSPKIEEIAKKYKAIIYNHKFVSYVEPVRNFAISKASGDWILIMDPDEELTDQLKSKLTEIVKSNTYNYVRVPRKNMIFGKWITSSRWWPDYNIRFFQKGSVSWNEIIHAVPETHGQGYDLPSEEKYALVHHHYQGIDQYIARMNRYTSVQATLKAKDNFAFAWKDIIVKSFGEFLSRYFAGEGYKDGVHGLSLSLLQGFSELVLYLKLWQLTGFKEKNLDVTETIKVFKEAESELHYWEADALVKSHGGIIAKIKRKFRLS
jgi:(heptosyl)LPS beta-1,4-glucosyltransferase